MSEDSSLKTKLQNKTLNAILGRLPSVIEAQCEAAAGQGQDKYTFRVSEMDSFIAMLGEVSQTRFRGLRASKGGELSYSDLDELIKPILAALVSSTGLKIVAIPAQTAKSNYSAYIAFNLDWS